MRTTRKPARGGSPLAAMPVVQPLIAVTTLISSGVCWDQGWQVKWMRKRDPMRRWNLLVVMTLAVAVVITLSGVGVAKAASTSSNFKGKPSVYDRTDPAYFVVNFSCSSNQLTGNWTWENSLKVSYSGTLGKDAQGHYASCLLTQNGDGSWTSSISSIPLVPQKGSPGATLTLTLSHISKTKTYVSNTTTSMANTTGCVNNSSNPPCIVIQTSGLGAAVGSLSHDTDFNSNPGPLADAEAPYGTLNLSVG
jgi:hypothetical protein